MAQWIDYNSSIKNLLQHKKKKHEIYSLKNLFCINDLKSAITNPKNSTKVITEAPKAKPSQPPTVAEKKNNTKYYIVSGQS